MWRSNTVCKHNSAQHTRNEWLANVHQCFTEIFRCNIEVRIVCWGSEGDREVAVSDVEEILQELYSVLIQCGKNSTCAYFDLVLDIKLNQKDPGYCKSDHQIPRIPLSIGQYDVPGQECASHILQS